MEGAMSCRSRQEYLETQPAQPPRSKRLKALLALWLGHYERRQGALAKEVRPLLPAMKTSTAFRPCDRDPLLLLPPDMREWWAQGDLGCFILDVARAARNPLFRRCAGGTLVSTVDCRFARTASRTQPGAATLQDSDSPLAGGDQASAREARPQRR
jgi:hypothetical protein